MSVIISYLFEFILQILFLLILTILGNKIIKDFFGFLQEKKLDDGNKLGRHIGSLERVLMAVGFYSHKWEIITAVVALKTLARFKQLDDKDFAEYFLIGSMASIIYCFIFTEFYRQIGFFKLDRWSPLLNNLQQLFI
ncbi:MAG: hypothetical protein NDI63_03170 [Pseudobdellovibrio sp.]|nr:hypothetical protein [Pseudobdellovibrio sp.]